MQQEDKGPNATSNYWWQSPWGYKESIAVVIGFMVVGGLLQYTLGDFDYDLLRFPVNVITVVAMLGVVVALSFTHKTSFFKWFSGVPLSVSLIGALLILGVIMGLTPQISSNTHSQLPLGLDAVTRSWTFILVYFLTLLSLSCVVARRLLNFQWKDYAFYLNHLGLLLLLMAAGMGASDMRRYVMYVEEGTTEWRVFNDDKVSLELPLAIKLNDFYMEEYTPKLAIIDKKTGDAIPKNNPMLLQIDTLQQLHKIQGWVIKMEKYLHEAIRNSDSTYRKMPMPGSCPAVYVTVTRIGDDFSKKGWVCCGNFAQLYMTIELTDQLSLVMTRPEAKLFRSDIVVYTKDEEAVPYQLEVNKPLKIGNWMIYQYGYDVDRGSASAWSSFELVYDPWLQWVYIGLWLFIAGSVLLLWEGKKKKAL